MTRTFDLSPADSRKANKARPGHEFCETGYGPNNNKKKRRPWQNGPQGMFNI